MKICKAIIQGGPILFSSLTPLENFFKFSRLKQNEIILIYTHQDGEFSKLQKEILFKVDLIFVFSANDKTRLENMGLNGRIVKIIGAINPLLFSRPVHTGSIIVYVGTPVERKNPELFLEFAKSHPNLLFRILGKGWKKNDLWDDLMKISNIEYKEIDGPIRTEDLDYCSHYLMLSKLEGGPMTLIETVAAGLIPVSTKTGISSEFLSEVGYTKQLISSPKNFKEIENKLQNRYNDSEITYAIQIAKSYSLERLSRILKLEINSLLKNFKVNKK
jgi:glycosyltransferase involved in cell wall biosynthesis